MNPNPFTAIEIRKRLIPFFESRPEILFAYLFGSSARNQQTPLSDVDVAVWVSEKPQTGPEFPYGYESFLTSRLMHLLETNKVDLVIFNEAPPVLRHRIFTQGFRLYSKNPSKERNAFVHALHRYMDTTPLRRVQSFYLKRYLKALGPTRKSHA